MPASHHLQWVILLVSLAVQKRRRGRRVVRLAVVGIGLIGDVLEDAALAAGHQVVRAGWGETIGIAELDWLVRIMGSHAEAEPTLHRASQVMDHPGHLLAMAGQPPVVSAVVDPRPELALPRVVVPDTQLGQEFASVLASDQVVACPNHAVHRVMWQAVLREIALLPIALMTHRGPIALTVPTVHTLAVTMLREVIEIADAECVRFAASAADVIVASIADQARSGNPPAISQDPVDWLAVSAPLLQLAERHAVKVPLLQTLHTLISERGMPV